MVFYNDGRGRSAMVVSSGNGWYSTTNWPGLAQAIRWFHQGTDGIPQRYRVDIAAYGGFIRERMVFYSGRALR